MPISQIEEEIRRLPQKEQLQLLSWLAQYIRQHFSSTEEETVIFEEDIRLDEIKHPLEGTLLKYDKPFEPVASNDWHALQ